MTTPVSTTPPPTQPLLEDKTSPNVTGTVIADGATDVPVNAKVGISFTEAMDPLTINSTTFILVQGAMSVAGTVSYSGLTATFTPAAVLIAVHVVDDRPPAPGI